MKKSFFYFVKILILTDNFLFSEKIKDTGLRAEVFYVKEVINLDVKPLRFCFDLSLGLICISGRNFTS